MMEQDRQSGKRRGCTRRTFLVTTGAFTLAQAVMGCATQGGGKYVVQGETPAACCGPGSKCRSLVRGAFVRRPGAYGMAWPGEIYDGEAARAEYTRQATECARSLGLRLELRDDPIYSEAEGAAWIAQAESDGADGLFVVLLDRQQHAWPTAGKAIDSRVPAVVFAPLGAAFTTNTAPLAKRDGGYICSTDDFAQAAYGFKMLAAGTRLRETRFLVIRGNERKDTELAHFGTKLRYLPAATFLEEYERTPVTDEVRAIAEYYMRRARRVDGPAEQDVINGVRSYAVARTLLEREEADGITMDCLGALGKSSVSLPCIAWSRMLDQGVPAACEADLGACVTHAMVQYLFDRPGFEQDPVADTGDDCLIGAHCTCPTRLNGFSEPPEPFRLSHHHGKRDAVPVPVWKVGTRVTVADTLLGDGPQKAPEMLVSTGTVVENLSAPPSGGCVVSVKVKLDDVTELLDYPGFHQIFFYGDRRKELLAFCRLYGIRALPV